MTEPLGSVVVVSFNQVRFLSEALESVLEQDYPNLEVIVVDGGSTDGSLELVEALGARVRVIKAPGSSQAQAVNAGFAAARGEVVGWLNSDDRYLPGAVRGAVDALSADVSLGMVYGSGRLIDANGEVIGPFGASRDFDLPYLIEVEDYVLQPAAFMRLEAVRSAGGVDEGLSFGLDWDLWIRLGLEWNVNYVPCVWADSREHAATKTASGGLRRFRELQSIPMRYGAKRWSRAARIYGLDSLRRRWPTVFGAGSGADARALQHRWWPRLFLPMHWAVSRMIARWRRGR